jgi:hypothetical protein
VIENREFSNYMRRIQLDINWQVGFLKMRFNVLFLGVVWGAYIEHLLFDCTWV